MAVSRNCANLRSFLRKSYNKEVNEWFKDVRDPVPDNSGSRKNAKRACLILPKETQSMALIKTLAFRYVVQQVHLRPDVYGMPILGYDAEVKYRPQVSCFFLEDTKDIDAGYRAVEGQLSIRLMKETSESLTQGKLKAIANKVYIAFKGQKNDGYVWKKGKELYSYKDTANGHQFKILARTKSQATEVIEKLLNIVEDVYNPALLRVNEASRPASAFPTIPPTQRVLGKTYKEPRRRPIADVRFLYASIKIWGLPKPVILVDSTGQWREAIIKTYKL